MRRILGQAVRMGAAMVLSGLCAAGSGQAQTITDKLAFRVPGQVVAWVDGRPPMRGAALELVLTDRQCVVFASNTGVRVQLEGGATTGRLHAVASGRSARPLGALADQPFRAHVFPERTAVARDRPEHQGITLCAHADGAIERPAWMDRSGDAMRVSIRVLAK